MDRGKAFVQVLSCVLSRLVAANDAVRVPWLEVQRIGCLAPNLPVPHWAIAVPAPNVCGQDGPAAEHLI
jgi:hypothetical protein